MGTVLLLIDNSNIFISGKEKYGDPSARFSYSYFEKICAGNDTIVKKIIAGSTPPSNDRFWTQMEEKDYVLCKRKPGTSEIRSTPAPPSYSPCPRSPRCAWNYSYRKTGRPNRRWSACR